MARILLEGMEFYAYHGVLEEERIIGGKFIVDISFEVNISKAAKSDNIGETVNYQEIYDVVKNEMLVSSKLIEHVGNRILEAVKNKFPVSDIQLKVSKLRPPVNGIVNKVSVIL